MTTSPSLLSRRAQQRTAAKTPAAPAAPQAKEAADKASKLAAIQQDAQRRVAASWTIAKTLLPTQSPKVQQHLAAALISAPTAVLAETLRSTASMAFHAKNAAAFEDGVKQELNVILEDEALLNKLKAEVKGELKQDDSSKVAAAPTPEELASGQLNPPPPELPVTASKGKKAGPVEDGSAPVGDAQGENLPAPGAEGTPEAVPTEQPADYQEPAQQPAVPGEMGDPGAGVDAPTPGNEVADAATEGNLLDSINQVENEIDQIQGEVEEAGEEALDLASIFNPEVQADKAMNLAHEGEGADIPMDEAEPSDFGPSSTEDMMDAADLGAPQGEITDANFFKDAAGPDPMASLLGVTAAEVDVETGDMESHFKSDLAGDDRDAESDNADLLGEVLNSITETPMKQKRDTEPSLETPEPVGEGLAKAASAKPAAAKKPIKSVGTPTPGQGTAKQAGVAGLTDDAIAGLIFTGDE